MIAAFFRFALRSNGLRFGIGIASTTLCIQIHAIPTNWCVRFGVGRYRSGTIAIALLGAKEPVW